MKNIRQKTDWARMGSFQRRAKLSIGATGIILLYFLAFLAPRISPYEPLRKFSKNHPPSLGHNVFYLRNSSNHSSPPVDVLFKMWRRGHRETAKEIVLFRGLTLQPDEIRETHFRLKELGQTGELLLTIKESITEPILFDFSFNLPPSISEESSGSMELGFDDDVDEDRRLEISIPAGGGRGRAVLPPRLFVDSYMGVNSPDRLLGLHLFGTDSFERDILSRLIYSARPTALISFAAMIIAICIGTPFGFFSGYFSGWTERILMRISDVFSSIPRFFLIVAIVAIWGQNILLITISIGITGWMEPARFINAKVKTLMEKDYILSSRSTGRTWWRIIIYDIMPNILPHIFVMAAYGAGIAVLMESSLSYVSLGVAEPAPSWGNMLANAHTTGAGSIGMERIWQVLAPGLAIAGVVISFNFLADGLEQQLGADNE